MFAQVATHTHPRYSPKVPSTTTLSIALRGAPAEVRRNSSASTTSRVRITSTLGQIHPACTVRIQPPFSSREAIAGVVTRRGSCWSHHCHSVYRPSAA